MLLQTHYTISTTASKLSFPQNSNIYFVQALNLPLFIDPEHLKTIVALGVSGFGTLKNWSKYRLCSKLSKKDTLFGVSLFWYAHYAVDLNHRTAFLRAGITAFFCDTSPLFHFRGKTQNAQREKYCASLHTQKEFLLLRQAEIYKASWSSHFSLTQDPLNLFPYQVSFSSE